MAPFTDAMNIDPLGRELEAYVEEAVVHMKSCNSIILSFELNEWNIRRSQLILGPTHILIVK